MRLAAVVLTLAGMALGATALARGGSAAAGVLHLEGSRACGVPDLVTLRITPGDGDELAWLSVRVGGRQTVRLTGVTGAASVSVLVPHRGARVGVSAETLDGRRLAAGRSYAPCPSAPAAPRRERPPTIVGGGEA